MNEAAENLDTSRDQFDDLPDREPQGPRIVAGIKVPRAATEWGCRRINDSGVIEPLAYGYMDDGGLAQYFPISDLSLEEIRNRWGAGNYQIKFFKRSAHGGLVNATGSWSPIYKLSPTSEAVSPPNLPEGAPRMGPPTQAESLGFSRAQAASHVPQGPSHVPPYAGAMGGEGTGPWEGRGALPSPPQGAHGPSPAPSSGFGAPSQGMRRNPSEGQVPPAAFEPPQALLSPLRDPAWHTRVVFEHARQLMQVHHAQYMETLRLFEPHSTNMSQGPSALQGLAIALLPKALEIMERLVARMEAPQGPARPPEPQALDPRLLEALTQAKTALTRHQGPSDTEESEEGDEDDDDGEDREPTPGELLTRFWEATDPETQNLLAKGVLDLPETAKSTLIGLIKAATGS